jgi:hypothetical protein
MPRATPILLALSISGCTLDTGLKTACLAQSDCNSGHSCINGRCSALSVVADGGQPILDDSGVVHGDAGLGVDDSTCYQPDGPEVPYQSSGQLSGLLLGAWLMCGNYFFAAPQDAVGITFSGEGTFQFLKWTNGVLSPGNAGPYAGTWVASGQMVVLTDQNGVGYNVNAHFEDQPRKMILWSTYFVPLVYSPPSIGIDMAQSVNIDLSVVPNVDLSLAPLPMDMTQAGDI